MRRVKTTREEEKSGGKGRETPTTRSSEGREENECSRKEEREKPNSQTHLLGLCSRLPTIRIGTKIAFEVPLHGTLLHRFRGDRLFWLQLT